MNGVLVRGLSCAKVSKAHVIRFRISFNPFVNNQFFAVVVFIKY